jgi:hypothetical protein
LLGVVAAIGFSSSSVFAEASGDGRTGPSLFTGNALDASLHALNHHIQDKYAQEDMLAALVEPRAPDFAVAAVASAAVPTFIETSEPGAFGYAIVNDKSLNRALELFNTEVAMRGSDVFIRVATEATSKGEAFAIAAVSAGVEEKMARYRDESAAVTEGFGSTIRDGASLEYSVAALNQRMQDQVDREIRLASAVPPIDGTSFMTYLMAMAISY